MVVLDLPREIKLTDQNLWLDGGSASAGAGLDGREQILFTENRRWVGQLDFAHLQGKSALLGRSIGSRLRGRAHVLRVSVCNAFTARFLGNAVAFYRSIGVDEGDIAFGSTRFSDGVSFGDGSGFSLPSTEEPRIVYDASVGATSLTFEGFIGRNIEIGARFSINDYLYEIASNDDGVVTFNPPLRESVNEGQVVQVSTPTILVRLRDDDGWRPFMRNGRYTLPFQVDVVEAFDR